MAQNVRKAMVVEDDPFNLQMISAVLEDRGYTVYTAGDGERGMKLMEETNDIDVIITDIFMPHKEGIGFIRAIRSRRPHVKVIAMTGAVNFDKISDTAHNFGADLTIRKPFDINDFADMVDNLVAASTAG